MSRAWSKFVLVACVACRSETDLGGDLPEYGLSKPPPIETPWREDRIVQVTIPVVDALFVVDNSCSMNVEQELLVANFPSFLPWFQNSELDYHIGVTATDMNDPALAGRLRVAQGVRWVQADTEEPEAVFSEMATLGTTGSGYERGLDATFAALDTLAYEDNLGFLRDGSGVHVTIVSDENDYYSSISRDDFIAWMNGLRWNARMVTFSSIVGPVTGCPAVGSPGLEYLAVTAAVGGVTWPICTDDWVTVLDTLGFTAIGLSREFYLSQLPVPGTLSVSLDVDGVIQNNFVEGIDWTYSSGRNSLTFVERVPESYTTVILRYQVLSSLESGDAQDTTISE